MKRQLLIFVTAVLAVASLVGCGKKEEGNPVTPDDSKFVSPTVKPGNTPGGGAGGASQTAPPSTQ